MLTNGKFIENEFSIKSFIYISNFLAFKIFKIDYAVIDYLIE